MEPNIDFDYLCNLNKTNPKKFEEVRQQAIEQLINSAPKETQQRLRGLQFQVDAKREIHKDAPFVTCMEISKMMHQSFDKLRYYLNEATGKKGFTNYQPPQNQNANQNDSVVVSLNREA